MNDRAGPLERHRQRCRLGIVEHHHVPGSEQRRQRPCVVIGRSVERRELVHPEDVSIAWLALQMIIEALGHPEELDRTTQHHPPDVNPRASPVRQQRTSDLRNPTANGGRVHPPNRPSAQHVTGALLGLRSRCCNRGGLRGLIARVGSKAEPWSDPFQILTRAAVSSF